MCDYKKLAERQIIKQRGNPMTFEELRKILNDVSEGEDKSALERPIDRICDDGRYEQELIISATSGRMFFLDKVSEDDTEIEA
jgi:hypothetical protein